MIAVPVIILDLSPSLHLSLSLSLSISLSLPSSLYISLPISPSPFPLLSLELSVSVLPSLLTYWSLLWLNSSIARRSHAVCCDVVCLSCSTHYAVSWASPPHWCLCYVLHVPLAHCLFTDTLRDCLSSTCNSLSVAAFAPCFLLIIALPPPTPSTTPTDGVSTCVVSVLTHAAAHDCHKTTSDKNIVNTL